jgi:hypothetical protein
MPDESLTACKACGAEAIIRAFLEEGVQHYQGYCPQCDATAPAATNYQRAVDFWQGWQEDGGSVAEEKLDLDLDADADDAYIAEDDDDTPEDAPDDEGALA